MWELVLYLYAISIAFKYILIYFVIVPVGIYIT